MKACLQCRALIKDDATSCRWCEASVVDPQSLSSPDTARGTKPCPFCAEDILSSAIRCKHCKSDLVSGAGSTARSALPFPAVPGAAPTSGVVFFLMAFLLVVLSVLVLGPFGPMLLVLGTSIWAGIDASTHKLNRYQNGVGGPVGACLGSLLLWIFVFPWYLAIRSRIRAGVQPVKA